MTSSLILQQASSIAYEHHTGQLYNGIDYFESHIVPVTNLVREMVRGFSDRKIYITVSYLHDIIEDTNFSKGSLRKFGAEVYDAVMSITKWERETYMDYIVRCSKNKYSRLVKMADLTINIKTCLENNRMGLLKRYTKALDYLANTESE